MKTNKLYKLIVPLLFLAGSIGVAWGQGNNDKNSYSNVTITHKKNGGVWYSDTYQETHSRNQGSGTDEDWLKDTFDEKDGTTTLLNTDISIQKAHEYREVIYMSPGETRELILPDIMVQGAATHFSLYHYQRWYDYSTDEISNLIEVVDEDEDNNRGGCGYKFKNGLVGGTFLLNRWSGNAFDQGLYRVKFTMPDKDTTSDVYYIACDASNYSDVTLPKEDATTMEEPTLSQRAIFEIRTASSLKLSEDYWYQEETIHFPTKSVGKTDEQVALAMAANNYIVEGNTEDNITCQIEYPEGTTQFLTLSNGSATLSGNTRKISFTYNNKNNESATGPQDGDIAYIKVMKGEYKIACFTLIFDAHTEALTKDEVDDAEENEGDNYFRTNEYLDANYTLLTKLDMDYTNVETDDSGYYPYPMNWNYGSYAFYTKALGSGVKYTDNPQWGEYAITSKFPFAQGNPQLLPDSKYHLYVDANEYPGTICTVPFREDLCPGASLYVTCWMMSTAGRGDQCDASVIFVLKGIDEKGNETIIHRQASGQIPYNRDAKKTGADRYSGAPLWNQLYFTFINSHTESDNQYDHYELEIQSNNAHTSGADCIIDDIRVYMKKPTASVTQQKLTCGERTRLRMDLSWDALISRLGLENDTTETNKSNAIDFCFIDSLRFDEEIATSPDNLSEAIRNSVINIGNEETYDSWYGTLYYDLEFDANKRYEEFSLEEEAKAEDPFSYGSLASNNRINDTDEPAKYGFYYSFDDADEKQLSVDFFANMVHGRKYMILVKDHDDEASEVFYESFGNPHDDPCAIVSPFKVEGQNVIRMNGEINEIYPEFCTGQIYTFDVAMRYYTDAGEERTYNGGEIYYDWFFGIMDEFNGTTDEDISNVTPTTSLREALQILRTYDKEASMVQTTDQAGTTTRWTLSLSEGLSEEAKAAIEEVRSVIEAYLNEEPVDGLHPKLVLHREELEIRMLENGLDLVVAPIEPATPIMVDNQSVQLCFEPMDLHLDASEHAPELQPGFEYVKYEQDGYNPAMRIGLQQIKDASEDQGKTISVNVRNAKFALTGVEGIGDSYLPDHIGLLFDHEADPPAANDNNNLYLTGTNDPQYASLFHDSENEEENHRMRDYVIGTVESLEAKPYEEGESSIDAESNVMKIRFSYGKAMTSETDAPKFEPREGYWYRFMLDFEEHSADESHDATQGTCQGNMIITMKVVPEYLVWQGTSNTQNWNNDALWKRATVNQLKKSSSDEYKDYNDAETENYPGYVPMLFSKVIMPEGNKVELYEAGFTGSSDSYRNMKWETERPEYMESPSTSSTWNDGGHPIQYDMMVYEDENGNLSTKPYRVNLCEQIHFEPKAEMLHAELLTYEKAWVDYKLKSNQWHTLASPLQGVVAGDFYTDGAVDGTTITDGVAGTENQEYFTSITFEEDEDADYNNANNNSRISPSVYQRGWKGETNMVSTGEPNDVAVAGNWSAVYNDVTEAYDPGTGFSLKVLDMPTGADGNAIFRLPKADNSYSYYDDATGNASGSAVPIDRNGDAENTEFKSGQLKTNDLTSASSEITVTLTQNGTSDYYLIGNPFMAHLDAAKFFDVNKSVLEQKYWTVTDDVQDVAASDGTTNWASTLDNITIAPLQSFFVQKKEGATSNDVTVTFNKDMQVLGGTEDDNTNTSALILTAQTADGKTSRAAIAYDAMAKATYETSEDAELFLDSNLSDVPTIYTVAGTMATSINRTSELYNIPVGIYGNSTETVTLSVEGLKNFSSAALYDAEKRTETPIREGTTITLPANTSGRYFLRAGAPTANESIATDAIQIYTLSGNRVMVTSTTPLKDIRVYTISGALVKQAKAGFCSHELYLPEDGIYVISAKSANGAAQTAKVAVN